MKTGRLYGVAAAAWLGIGVANGVVAFNANNDATRAEAVATALEAEGNPQADEWQAYADGREDDRNRFLVVVGTDVAIFAITATAAAVSIASRRREQELQPETPAPQAQE